MIDLKNVQFNFHGNVEMAIRIYGGVSHLYPMSVENEIKVLSAPIQLYNYIFPQNIIEVE